VGSKHLKFDAMVLSKAGYQCDLFIGAYTYARAQGDEQAMDKLREALSNPPAQLNIILGDAYSTECLHQEAQRAATEVHQQGRQT
jgi:hypothetical protein